MDSCSGHLATALVVGGLALAATAAGYSRITRCPAVDGSHRCSLDAGHSHATHHRYRDHSWWTL